jgi:hypothetical protein
VTTHLASEELVDIAEGTRSEASAPHLAACGSCRERLIDLRSMMSLAKDVDVPEPSPLFWDHFSSRVSAAVAAEASAPQTNRWSNRLTAWAGARAVQAMLVLAASLLLVFAINRRLPVPAVAEAPVSTTAETGTDPLVVTADEDVSLTVVASLTDGQDLETVREAGLAPRGSAEHAVAHMNDRELRELRRLLKEELSRSGA